MQPAYGAILNEKPPQTSGGVDHCFGTGSAIDGSSLRPVVLLAVLVHHVYFQRMSTSRRVAGCFDIENLLAIVVDDYAGISFAVSKGHVSPAYPTIRLHTV